jgi:hypothetical protein
VVVAAATYPILSLDQDIPEGPPSQARAARGAAVPEVGRVPPGRLVAGEDVDRLLGRLRWQSRLNGAAAIFAAVASIAQVLALANK